MAHPPQASMMDRVVASILLLFIAVALWTSLTLLLSGSWFAVQGYDAILSTSGALFALFPISALLSFEPALDRLVGSAREAAFFRITFGLLRRIAVIALWGGAVALLAVSIIAGVQYGMWPLLVAPAVSVALLAAITVRTRIEATHD